MSDTKARRDKIFKYIIDFKRRHDGCSPKIRRIMRSCDISSTSVVAHDLRVLENQGKIKRIGKIIKMDIMVIGGKWEYRPLPDLPED